MKADEYRYWQSRSVYERLDAISELTIEGYTLKGYKPDDFRLQRTLVWLWAHTFEAMESAAKAEQRKI